MFYNKTKRSKKQKIRLGERKPPSQEKEIRNKIINKQKFTFIS